MDYLETTMAMSDHCFRNERRLDGLSNVTQRMYMYCTDAFSEDIQEDARAWLLSTKHWVAVCELTVGRLFRRLVGILEGAAERAAVT